MADPAASEPRITAPVSRDLRTANIAGALRFWTKVLGFQEGPTADDATVDLVSGQARIRLSVPDGPPGSGSAEEGSRGSAIVFFETDDVRAMHAAIRRRGGKPSGLEKVNWIKMQMFQIQDPDGHVIWFGQSFHADSRARSRSMLTTVMPELPIDDVPAGVRHYRDVLGFSVNYEQHNIAVLDRDAIRVLLIARTPQHSGIGSAYFYVRDVDRLYAELLEKGANVQGEPVSQPWGLREFSILDVERNRLTFGQTFE
jgi:predicted enzyme related to lactoylglutathione lyase